MGYLVPDWMQKHSPDGKKCGCADAASLGGPLVMQVDMLNTSFRKSLGWALFTLSCLSFLLVFLVPFLNLTNTEKVATAGGLYLFCQITWWLCIPLLGKEFISWGRSLWKVSAQKIKSAIGKRNL